MDEINDQELNKAFRLAVVIGASVIGSLVIYVIVVEYVKAYHQSWVGFIPLGEMKSLRYVFYALSIIHVFLLRIIKGFLLKRLPTADRLKLINRLSQASIISTVLSEGPALYGLIFFFLSGISRDFYLLLIVSAILLFMYFPRIKNWQYWLSTIGS